MTTPKIDHFGCHPTPGPRAPDPPGPPGPLPRALPGPSWGHPHGPPILTASKSKRPFFGLRNPPKFEPFLGLSWAQNGTPRDPLFGIPGGSGGPFLAPENPRNLGHFWAFFGPKMGPLRDPLFGVPGGSGRGPRGSRGSRGSWGPQAQKAGFGPKPVPGRTPFYTRNLVLNRQNTPILACFMGI